MERTTSSTSTMHFKCCPSYNLITSTIVWIMGDHSLYGSRHSCNQISGCSKSMSCWITACLNHTVVAITCGRTHMTFWTPTIPNWTVISYIVAWLCILDDIYQRLQEKPICSMMQFFSFSLFKINYNYIQETNLKYKFVNIYRSIFINISIFQYLITNV